MTSSLRVLLLGTSLVYSALPRLGRDRSGSLSDIPCMVGTMVVALRQGTLHPRAACPSLVDRTTRPLGLHRPLSPHEGRQTAASLPVPFVEEKTMNARSPELTLMHVGTLSPLLIGIACGDSSTEPAAPPPVEASSIPSSTSSQRRDTQNCLSGSSI